VGSQWLRDYDCSPWENDSYSYMTGVTDGDGFAAFELRYSANFVKDGHLQFRYNSITQMSSDGLLKNGHFTFYMDGVQQLSNFNPHDVYESEFKVTVPEGFHDFTWVYKKYIEEGQDDNNDLYAEITYFEAIGIKMNDDFCYPCIRGSSQEGASSCINCPADFFFEAFSAEVDEIACIACPTGYYSFPGSVGVSSCNEMEECDDDEYVLSYDNCKNG
jgi:hypothetical protein